MQRAENIRRLQAESFDLCIIGGGASGAGCALDAALRGLKVALIEKTDFASETSSRSTKLVHGGVRYLEQAFKNLDFAQLRQVRHGLVERHVVLKNAPHLAKPLGLITPVFSWWEGFYFSIGLKLYDWIAGKNGQLPPSRWLSKKETLQLMPGISPNIHSSVLYYDGQLDDARYCLALIQSAAACGAVVANHLEVIDFEKDTNGKIKAAKARDVLDPRQTIRIQAAQFVNCCGPFADPVRLLANPGLAPRITPSKGVHLTLPLSLLNSEHAMLIPKTKDGRIVFAIPFDSALLLGTTDEPYGNLDQEPRLESRDLEFLIDALQPFISSVIDPKQVRAGFGGIRPLISMQNHPDKISSARQTKTLLRDHEVERDEQSGLISLLGGKWTTYRLMAQDTIKEVLKYHTASASRESKTNKAVSDTANHPLFGSAGYTPDLWKKLQAFSGLEPEICQHLASKYGGQAGKVLEIGQEDTELLLRIHPNHPFIVAEIVYTVREEMAANIRDFLCRRIRLEILDWQDTLAAVPTVAKWMGKELNWTKETQKAHSTAYISQINNFIQAAHSIHP